ncbi:MAG: nucleotidyltransferase family protein [Halofilum sp. (in: g-proteobacteria)]|nr:nucleotidyltransferase family protein [Halofilum sp. (in: g-proteobacteria)]
MNAMILAAGRGERMRPLTDDRPKPLLDVGGRPLIDWHLGALARAGFARVVINTAWQGRKLRAYVGDGGAWGLDVRYSDEGDRALETAGGIAHALPLLGPQPFAVINGDIYTDYPFEDLTLPTGRLAHLVLVDNPPQHPDGDFALDGARVTTDTGARLTFAGIGVYRPALFSGLPPQPLRLAPILRRAIAAGLVSGEHYRGAWHDIGTPERLRELDRQLQRSHPPR